MIVRGRADVKRFMLQQVPEQLEKLLAGAGRAGGQVIADEAKLRSVSPQVSAAIAVKVKSGDGRTVVRVLITDDWARSVGAWLEYGTAAHFISVDESQRQGMSVGRINDRQRAGTLVIGGKPVGSTVYHPGATPHPFMRVSLDLKERDAIAAAQSYINARVKPSGILPGPVGGDDA